jgi:hypothetical protein
MGIGKTMQRGSIAVIEFHEMFDAYHNLHELIWPGNNFSFCRIFFPAFSEKAVCW